jgi:hypothetical protein
MSSLRCGFCDWEGPIDPKALREHFAEEHPEDLRMLETDNGPLDALMMVAPIFDQTGEASS